MVVFAVCTPRMWVSMALCLTYWCVPFPVVSVATPVLTENPADMAGLLAHSFGLRWPPFLLPGLHCTIYLGSGSQLGDDNVLQKDSLLQMWLVLLNKECGIIWMTSVGLLILGWFIHSHSWGLGLSSSSRLGTACCCQCYKPSMRSYALTSHRQWKNHNCPFFHLGVSFQSQRDWWDKGHLAAAH